MYSYEMLESFWKRFSKVALDKLVLEKERSVLQAENMQLKQYLDGISVNDEIMSQTNPLMILSSRRVLEYVSKSFSNTRTEASAISPYHLVSFA